MDNEKGLRQNWAINPIFNAMISYAVARYYKIIF